MKRTTHTYKQINGLNIELDVYCQDHGVKGTPVIVLLHGGALIYGDRSGYAPDSDRYKHFFQMGATVITMDHRLAPETKLVGIIEDIQDGFRWIHSEGRSIYQYDTSKIVVVGHSAGGYLALMCGFCLDVPPTAIISYYGYGDITGEWYTQPDLYYRSIGLIAREDSGIDEIKGRETTCNYDGRGVGNLYRYYRQNGLWTQEVGGVDPNTNSDYYSYYNPIENISEKYPPVLFLHGDHDTDVPYNKSVNMSTALTQEGIHNELITIKNGPHRFDVNIEDKQVRQATAQVKSFVRKIFF